MKKRKTTDTTKTEDDEHVEPEDDESMADITEDNMNIATGQKVHHVSKNVTITTAESGNIVDLTTESRKLSSDKYKLGGGWQIAFGQCAFKGRASSFQECIILTRESTLNALTNKLSEPFTVNLPLKCLEPLHKAINMMIGETDEKFHE